MLNVTIQILILVLMTSCITDGLASFDKISILSDKNLIPAVPLYSEKTSKVFEVKIPGDSTQKIGFIKVDSLNNILCLEPVFTFVKMDDALKGSLPLMPNLTTVPVINTLTTVNFDIKDETAKLDKDHLELDTKIIPFAYFNPNLGEAFDINTKFDPLGLVFCK